MRISYDFDDLDLVKVTEWLTEESYWAFGRDPELVKQSFQNSISICILGDKNEFLGVGRIVTDKSTFGWLCDVFVNPESRGKGIGHLIAQAAIDYFKDLPKFRLILKTRDAHEVYEDVGFKELSNPDSWMAIEHGF